MKYISEIIGEKYKEWERGQYIFITAPTGSGKTTFILNQLVSFAAQNKKKVLYFVNRRILKKQLEEKVATEIESYLRLNNMGNYIPDDVIRIETYQAIEEMIQDNRDMQYYNQFDYIVADEAHYFYHDATYNTATFLSYNWIMSQDCRISRPIFIFISATMDRVKNRIVDDIGYSGIFNNLEQKFEYLKGWNKVTEYYCEADYSFIDLHAFDKEDEVFEIILSEKKQKWMVFVSSIKQGNLLETQLLKQGIDAIFIDARYDKNTASLVAVEQVATEKKVSNRVLIATSVLDNGVSIEDENLRNLIVMAEIKDDFLQMLGRKRVQNNEKIKLYICKSTQGHFEQRLKSYVLPNLKFIRKYEQFYKNPFMGPLTVQTFDRLLRDVLQNESTYNYVQRTCYVLMGCIHINKFAVEQFDYLNLFYKDLIARFEREGELAFVKLQAEWIGVSNIEENYEAYVVDKERENRNQIIEVLNSVVKKKLTSIDSENLKEEIRKNLLYLLRLEHLEEDMVKEVGNLKKTGRPLSHTVFNNVMRALNLDFRMKESNGAPYIILKADQQDLKE